MKESTREQILQTQEIKAIKMFLVLFYTVYIGFDFSYYFIIPYFGEGIVGFPPKGMGGYAHIILILLLPVAIFIAKKWNAYVIKYLYFFSFLVIEFIDNFLIYWNTNIQYSSGNIVEILFLLFAPIFVNKRFFWVVLIVMSLKYILYGILFRSIGVVTPLFLIIFFGIFGFILLSQVISYINGMVKLYEEAKQKEKLAVVGQMAASIAHEVKNPLSALKGFTQLQQEKDGGENNYYPIMLNEIDRINLIVSDLLIIGKPSATIKKQTDLERLLKYVVSSIEPDSTRQNIDIQLQVQEGIPPVVCDENKMKQVFINLLKNAVESMPDGGKITIRADFKDLSHYISISDEGVGIPEEILDKLGEPFYTTKSNGTGLGLMVTKKIIEEHEGNLQFNNNQSGGATIMVTIPKVKI